MKVNRMSLYILFAIGWMLPQVIIHLFENDDRMRLGLLCVGIVGFGMLIFMGDFIDRLFIMEDKDVHLCSFITQKNKEEKTSH